MFHYICGCGGDYCYPHHFIAPYDQGGRDLVLARMKKGWKYRAVTVGPLQVRPRSRVFA